jgi:chromosome segregation ATPase
MAFGKSGKKVAAVETFDWTDDPRYVAAEARIATIEREQVAKAEALQEGTQRLKHINLALSELDMKILLGEAGEDDRRRVQAERDRVEQETTALRVSIGTLQSRLKALHAARGQLETELRKRAQRRALAAYRETVEQMKPLLLDLVPLNDHLRQLIEICNFPDIPRPFLELRNGADQPLDRWLKDAKGFDFSQCD